MSIDHGAQHTMQNRQVTNHPIVQFHRPTHHGRSPASHIEAVLRDRLPTQEGIGLPVDNIPGVAAVGLTGGHGDY